jgi:lipopolysaccharide transport system ATP-binding protein
MEDYAIKVENLHKTYRVSQGNAARYSALRDVLTERAGVFFSRLAAGQNPFATAVEPETFHALRNVSFEVKQGEVTGIIGRNGAGKSTLLKILSRITEPDRGQVVLNGRVASLLEVGTGFHPELTGRENVFLSGTILGMRRREIQARFDDIVEFAGIERHLDKPVKRYSTGMYVRLGFAVAAHLETEILLIDEVLAVGDAEFQRKCLEKVKMLITAGKSVLLVSHNLGIINSFCDQCILLEQGSVLATGKPEKVTSLYTRSLATEHSQRIVFKGPLSDSVDLLGISINHQNPLTCMVLVSPLSDLELSVKLQVGNINRLRITLSLYCDGVKVFTLQDRQAENTSPCILQANYTIPAKVLRPATYFIAIGGLENDGLGDWFWRQDICSFNVLEEWAEDYESINQGLVNVKALTSRTIIHENKQ